MTSLDLQQVPSPDGFPPDGFPPVPGPAPSPVTDPAEDPTPPPPVQEPDVGDPVPGLDTPPPMIG